MTCLKTKSTFGLLSTITLNCLVTTCHAFIIVVPARSSSLTRRTTPMNKRTTIKNLLSQTTSETVEDEDTVSTLTEKLKRMLILSGSDDNDGTLRKGRLLDLFRTRLSTKALNTSMSSRSGLDNITGGGGGSIQSLYINSARVDTSTIPNAGLGLFATRDIPKGALITCYPGDALVLASDSIETKHEYDDDGGGGDGDDEENRVVDLKNQSNWVVTWGDHVTSGDLIANGIDVDAPNTTNDSVTTKKIPDNLLSYMIHATDDYGLLGLPVGASWNATDDTTYLGHFANDGASNIPYTLCELAPYVIESSELSNAVHKAICGCHMVTVATRDIRRGQEIFVVYGPGYWMDANGIEDYDDEDDDGDYDYEGDGEKEEKR